MKKIRLRQLIPTKFATAYRANVEPGDRRDKAQLRRYQIDLKLNINAYDVDDAYRVAHRVSEGYCGVIGEPRLCEHIEVDAASDTPTIPVYSQWWMWLGRCFKVRHTAI
jgi:hypothetical protein